MMIKVAAFFEMSKEIIRKKVKGKNPKKGSKPHRDRGTKGKFSFSTQSRFLNFTFFVLIFDLLLPLCFDIWPSRTFGNFLRSRF